MKENHIIKETYEHIVYCYVNAFSRGYIAPNVFRP